MDYGMDGDDDLPPMLVDSTASSKLTKNSVGEIGDGLADLNLVKVPITIVTGKSTEFM